MRIKMLRNLAIKPHADERDQRHEGQEYDVSSKEGATLIAQGLALDVNKQPAADDDATPPKKAGK